MSTRATLVYDDDKFHIFEEVFTEDICFEFGEGCYKNEKYDVPALKLDDVKKLHEQLGKFLARMDGRPN